MSDSQGTGATPQFETAQYAGTAGTDICKICGQPIAGQYYRVNAAMACPSCADTARREGPKETPGAFARSVFYGTGAAVAGLIIYATFGIVTGLVIGYLSLAVGYMVAKAMMKGSGGIGGKRYQVVAVVLTYAAVSMASIPIYIAQSMKEHKTGQQETQKQTADPSAAQAEQSAPAKKTSMGPIGLLGMLALIGLASPFLELASPIQGLIGLVILFVGVNIAWKIAAGSPRAVVDGPF